MNTLTPFAKTGVTIPTVCIDCRYIGNRPSGIAEVVHGLVDHCPALAPEIHFRLLKSPKRLTPLSTASNVSESVVKWGANSPATMWFLPEIAALTGVDLFHAPHNTLPARLPSKAVTTVHDIMWLTHPHWCEAPAHGAYAHAKRRFYQHGIARALKSSAMIATVSEATRAAIIAFAPALADRIVVTRSGVSERFKPVERDANTFARLGLAINASYALIVGQSAPYKNHEGALQAFASALASHPEAHLVVVQRQGRSAGKLQKLAARLGISDKVSTMGAVSEAELFQLYSNARLLLHPSFCEGFGNPIAEAMACGAPVITCHCSAPAEVSGGAAALVDPHSIDSIAIALRDVWHDADRCASMRDAGLARAKELQWIDFARANVRIYRSLLDPS